MILMLVLAGQPDGIGFLIAAKSILRFNELARDADRRVSEYVIIGTLASFAWALGAAFATRVDPRARSALEARAPLRTTLAMRSGYEDASPMFGIPGKPPVTMTPAAEAQIARLMAQRRHQGPAHRREEGRLRRHGIHHGIRRRDPARTTRWSSSNGARVMIAPMAQMFLFGTEIDYADRADRIRASGSTTPTSPKPAAAAS